MTHSATPVARTSRAVTVLRTLQVASVLTVLNLAVQFVTAGEMFPGGGPEDIHATGAITLHVFTGVVAIAAIAWFRPLGGALWPAVLASLVFVASFVQAYYGARDSLGIHIPGAMLLTVGAVWILAWSFSSARD
ncbi:hypothetical protein EV383_3533 [Pseudonocardia sediminis]|uniref:DoxX-like protein n=1 Tax=Pseudonocardia sediminis TaxID=1397368 RepID=A0A4Q7UXL1_PSEST|nr:hypothetical protein [Pseudonocardia sediminis]RZT86636.1 hypothetical protein EV383_3533 [Pseudonocardia sediminis]